MMGWPFFWCAVYLSCLLVVGYGVLVWLGGSFGTLENFGISACVGPAVVGASIIGLSMLGFVPTRGIVLAIGTAGLLSIVTWRNSKHGRGRAADILARHIQTRGHLDFWWNLLTLLVVGFGLICIIHQALLVTYEWDGYGIWQLKARVLASQSLIPRPNYFFDANLSFSHLRYPILVSMVSAGVTAMTGPTDILGKTPDILLFLGFAAVMFGAIRRMRGTAIAAAVAISMLLLSDLVRHAAIGTADFPLTAYYACSIVCLLEWQRNRRFRDLFLTFLFSAAMTWTKNEGLPLAAINGLIIFCLTPMPLARRQFLAATAFSIAVFGVYIIWPIYCRGFPRTDEDYASHLNLNEIVGHIGRIPRLVREFARAFSDQSRWSIFWYLLAAVVILNLTRIRQRDALTLWLLFWLHLGCMILAYMIVSVRDYDQLIYLSIDRLVLHLAPPAAFLMAVHWPKSRSARGGFAYTSRRS